MTFESFKWINETSAAYADGVLKIQAPDNSDYFNSPMKEAGTLPAPVADATLYYTELTGDFIFRAKVSLEFKNTFDASALLIYENENIWAKLALENSDLPCRKPAVVSVVTRRISDDCNGPVIDGNCVWLQIARADDCFAFHYSPDGVEYRMVRLFTFPVGKTVKVGFEAQAPMGEGGERRFEDIVIEHKAPNSIRAGV